MFPSTLRLFCHKWGDSKEKKTRERLRTSLFKANEAVLTFYLYFKSSPYCCPSIYASLTVSRNLIVLQQLFISLFSTSCPSPAFACVNFVPAVNGRAGRITEIIHAGGCLEAISGRWSRWTCLAWWP